MGIKEAEHGSSRINYNASEMLTEVNNAIYAVLVGGQSYKIGTRQLTRADLSLLYKLRTTSQHRSQQRVQPVYWMIPMSQYLMGGRT